MGIPAPLLAGVVSHFEEPSPANSSRQVFLNTRDTFAKTQKSHLFAARQLFLIWPGLPLHNFLKVERDRVPMSIYLNDARIHRKMRN